MPLKFNKLGIAFQYPENWQLDEQEALVGQQSVTVCSPGGAFWSVSIHPKDTDPAELAQAAVKAMEEEYEDLEHEETRETVAGRDMLGYDLHFYYLDLTNTACIRCLRTDRGTCAVFFQAEDREFDRLRSVFLAMTTSLLDNLQRVGFRGGQGKR